MSASNWATCPRCTARNKARGEALAREAHAAYGKISEAEFIAKVKEASAANALHAAVPATFREDYEIYGADSGAVVVDYGGSCEKCGLKVSFTHTVPIPGVAE